MASSCWPCRAMMCSLSSGLIWMTRYMCMACPFSGEVEVADLDVDPAIRVQLQHALIEVDPVQPGEGLLEDRRDLVGGGRVAVEMLGDLPAGGVRGEVDVHRDRELHRLRL